MSTTNILDLNNRIDALEKISHNVEPIQQQIDELKAWTDSGTKDATGNPIILTDGAELEPTALTVTLEESEGGYTECVVDRDGKNLLPLLAVTKTVEGITYTVNDDGTVTMNGTATGLSYLALSNASNDLNDLSNVLIKAGTSIIVSIGIEGKGLVARYTDGSYENLSSGLVFTPSKDIALVYIQYGSGTTLNNVKLYPMIRLASVSDATFEPYQHDTASISFGETINAGSVDFITGIVTVTEPEAKTLTLTPDNITLLKGNNVIRSAGNIDISYHPDNLYSAELVMDNRIAALEEKISILAGGDTGQVLTKTSDDNYDATWETLPATRTTMRKSEK